MYVNGVDKKLHLVQILNHHMNEKVKITNWRSDRSENILIEFMVVQEALIVNLSVSFSFYRWNSYGPDSFGSTDATLVSGK